MQHLTLTCNYFTDEAQVPLYESFGNIIYLLPPSKTFIPTQ